VNRAGATVLGTVAALLVAGPARGQDWSVVTYHVADLTSLARQVDVAATVVRAARLDSSALHTLFGLAATADTAALARSTSLPTLLWGLLKRWGDGDFAANLGTMPEGPRHTLLRALDRAFGSEYRRRFPRTWELGAHDPDLIPDSATPQVTGVPDSRRVYLVRQVAERPGTDPNSCGTAAYPPRFEERGISGRVVFEFVLDDRGHIERRSFQVAAATHPAFIGPAELVLRACQFVAGRLEGEPVRVRMRWAVEFVPGQLFEWDLDPSVVSLGLVQPLAEAVGVDYAFAVAQAMHGDSAALAALLDLPSVLDMEQQVFVTFPAVMDVVLQRVGDVRFAGVLAGMAPPARAAASNVLRGIGRGHRFPRTDSLFARAFLPVHRAKVLADSTHGIAQEEGVSERPERVAGSCSPLLYPEALRQQGIEGRVMVEIVIDTTGRAEPDSVRARYASHLELIAPSLAVVAHCRYRPGRINGRPVRVRVRVPVNFSIRH
jgi:TonB family protein